MKVVSLYDMSGIMVLPWVENGHEAITVDLVKPTTYNRATHMVADAMSAEVEAVVSTADILFGFPPCTDLAVSGSAHFKRKGPESVEAAMELVYRVVDLGYRYHIPWMIENPVGLISSEWRKPDFLFDPYEYGGYLPVDHRPRYPIIPRRDAYPKRTCLWMGCGFKVPVRRPVSVPGGESPQHLYIGGKSRWTKYIRSLTPEGFARAVYEANVA